MADSWYSLITFLASLTICFVATSCTPEEIARENLRKLGRANTHLAMDILQQLPSERKKNVFFSPFSLSNAFGMLYYGTRCDTAQELRKALGYEKADLPEEFVHQTFKKYLTSLASKDPSAYILKSANSILLDKRLDVKSSYVREVQDLYQATVKEVDFVKENHDVVEDVNNWVKEKTNGKIVKLLDQLDPSTVLVLLNAVYFKGTWKTKFDPRRTTLQKFYNKGLISGVKKVPMMKMTEEFNYASFDDAQAIEIPYKGENISMVVLLPNKRDGLESLERELSPQKLHTIRNQMFKTEVLLGLPKFKFEYEREMSGDFKSLGANSIFKPGADFSGMTSDNKVYVSQVLHKAVIEVNEEGSEAAAVTGLSFVLFSASSTPPFIADHPFLFAIVDNRNDMILFVGRVTEL